MQARIEASVSKVPITGCWMWMHRINSNGYGIMSVYERGKTKKVQAHRAAFEAFIGQIPTGLQLDHVCRHRWCVNPWHLDPVRPGENQVRSPISHSGRTHCKRGHELTGSNVYKFMQKGYECRQCRACKAMHHRGEL